MCEMHERLHPSPCLHCHPPTYIRMVHNLIVIERCLLLRMDREQCVKALADLARIQPLVTLIVWKELQKENKDFFFHISSPYLISPTPTPHTCKIDIFGEHHDLQEEINPQRYWRR